MSDASLPLLLVTGDLVHDCHLYGGVKTAATSFSEPGTEYKTQAGGAALCHRLLGAAAKAQVRARLEDARRALEAASPTPDRTQEERAAAEAARPLQARVRELEAAHERGGHWAVELGVSLPPELPEYLTSYGVWTPRPARRGARELVWRVERHFGYGPSAGADREPLLPARFDGQPLLTVIDDGALSFRQRRSERAWPSFAGTGHFLLKMSSPLCRGDLWPALSGARDRLIVVVSAADLRREDARISQRLSWEASAEDTLAVLEKDPIGCELCKAGHVIVTFGAEGALWVRRGADGQRVAMLLFSPYEQEGDHGREFEGTVYGFGTSVIAGIAHELMRRHAEAAEAARPSPFSDPAALARALEQGIVGGLRARRLLLELGHGSVGRGEPGFPEEAMARALAKGGGGFVSVNVPSPAARGAHAPWTILQRAESTGTEGSEATALVGLARLTARFGTSALSNVPGLRLGGLFTVDRSEIEALRTLETAMRAYEAGPVQKKSLSLGVFGPPGAGKSFAVKALSKAIFGDKAPFLEFNLSQFNGPGDLVGAFHRVRDAVLQGATPVAFWDEFDSQRYTWLQYLLAPMQDGCFQEGQITHPIGKCVFVFAGGTSSTFEEFGPKAARDSASEDEMAAHRRALEEFKLLKGPDFKSRLHGYLDVLGPNERKNTKCPDITWPIRRALLLRALLGLRDGEVLAADPGLLHALLRVPRYEHGARSFEKIVQALARSRIDGRLQRSGLPPAPVLGRDTDAERFVELMQERDAFRNHPDIEVLANAVHEHFRKATDPKDIKPSANKPYAELGADFQAANRASARRIPDHLALIDFALEPAHDSDRSWREPLDQAISRHLERLAQAEHLGWCEERQANGWRYGDTRNDALKQHPSLVDWSKLSPADRDKDRRSVQAIPDVLAMANYKAVRAGARAETAREHA